MSNAALARPRSSAGSSYEPRSARERATADDVEESVISAMFVDRDAIAQVRSVDLRPADFEDRRRGLLFGAILAVDDRGSVADPLTVCDELDRAGKLAAAGGKDYVGYLVDVVPNATGARDYAALVLDAAKARAMAYRLETDAAKLRSGSIAPADIATQLQPALDLIARGRPTGESLQSAVCAADVTPGPGATFSIEGLLTAGDLGLIVGEDGSLKSALTVALGGAKAGGYRAFGRFNTTPAGPVLFVSEEDPAEVITNRLDAFCRGHGWDRDRVFANVHIIARSEVRLTAPHWKAHIQREIARIQPAICFFDPLAEMQTGEENSNTEMRAIVQAMRAFGNVSGANIIPVHHFGKPGEGKRPRDLIRGATALPSGSRCSYVVAHNEEARELTVTCIKLSRSEKPAPFVIRYLIESEPMNRASWTRARFDYVTAGEAQLDHAEAFVIEQLSSGERMSTTDLKGAATGTGVSGQGIARALVSLEMRRVIDHEPGPRGAKLWGLLTLPSDSRQGGQGGIDVAGQGRLRTGNVPEDVTTLPTAFSRQGAGDDRAADDGDAGLGLDGGL